MQCEPTDLPEVVLITPDVFGDERGFFLETFSARRYGQMGLPETFVQDNHSRSKQGILRGIHTQLEKPQGKLIRAVSGTVFDVAVDLRPASSNFARWVGRILSAESKTQLYIPPGFGHGFLVLSESADIEYKCTEYYAPDDELTISWDDPSIAISWPHNPMQLSAKDSAGVSLSDAEPMLARHFSQLGQL